MKIIATIADDRTPEGWQETHRAERHDITQEQALKHIEDIVRIHWNGRLKDGELPRRALSVALVEETLEEAYKLGVFAYDLGDEIDANPFPADGELFDSWKGGWTEGYTIDEEGEEEDE